MHWLYEFAEGLVIGAVVTLVVALIVASVITLAKGVWNGVRWWLFGIPPKRYQDELVSRTAKVCAEEIIRLWEERRGAGIGGDFVPLTETGRTAAKAG
jgi:hypothetical protein